MTQAERHRRKQTLYMRLAHLPRQEQNGVLFYECGDDVELRSELLLLLDTRYSVGESRSPIASEGRRPRAFRDRVRALRDRWWSHGVGTAATR